MSDDNLFDFDDNTVDNSEKDTNTVQHTTEKDPTTQPEKKASKPARKSGKRSGAKTGKVIRKQDRVPMHVRQPMIAEGRPGFKRRVVNDTPERVERLKMAGYEVVQDGTKIGDDIATQASSIGSASAKPVGGSNWGVLMEIPEDIYNEDQQTRHEKIDRDEEATLIEAAEKVGGDKAQWSGSVRIGGDQD